MGDLQEKLGLEFPAYKFVVEQGKIREFVQAVGDPNPVYVNSEAARQEGYQNVIAPPTFGVCIEMWGGPGFENLMKELGVNAVRILHAEEEFEYFKEINPGDEITATTRVSNIFRKEGKAGAMNFVTLETTHANQRAEKVLISRMMIVERL
ncbi:MAG: MaoC family dehydratase N-terminal domain-containing protein [Peptococcaceae bacterium]